MDVTTNEIWTILYVAPAISVAIFANKKEKGFSQKFKVFRFFQKFHFLPQLNNDLRNFLKKKILVRKNKIEKPEEKRRHKGVRKKGLKKWMNNVRRKKS